MTITATTAASIGAIDRVIFYNGTKMLGEVTSPPYQFTWNGVAAGKYDIKVAAYNSIGINVSDTVGVTEENIKGQVYK